MIPAITAFWTGLPKPVREAIMWIGAIIAVIILGKAYVRAKQDEAVQKQKAKQRELQAEVKIAVTHRQAEVLKEETHAANEALAARDGPLYPTADSVPDALKGVTFRPQGSGRGS